MGQLVPGDNAETRNASTEKKAEVTSTRESTLTLTETERRGGWVIDDVHGATVKVLRDDRVRRLLVVRVRGAR